MAYVITAVGAGGKTTYLTETGKRLAAAGRKVAFTTTTHIWDPGADAVAGIRFFGTKNPDGKLSAPEPALYEKICREYDVVLVEGDGSRRMPVKYPHAGEPVVPDNTDEIAVLMGRHAIGRKFGTVCHRFREIPENLRLASADTVVTDELLKEAAETYYIRPLRDRFPHARIAYVPGTLECSGLDRDVEALTLVLLASGFGNRFGGNKLLEPYRGKPLYRHMLDRLVRVSGLTEKKTEVLIVTQYPELIRAAVRPGAEHLSAVMNHSAAEGIAASVRLGTEEAVRAGSGAAAFFTADMPDLPEAEILRFLKQFLLSGKTCACMEADGEPVNPGAFRFRPGIREKLLSLSGDRGAMKVIRRHPADCYVYQTEPENVRDIDTRADLQREVPPAT